MLLTFLLASCVAYSQSQVTNTAVQDESTVKESEAKMDSTANDIDDSDQLKDQLDYRENKVKGAKKEAVSEEKRVETTPGANSPAPTAAYSQNSLNFEVSKNKAVNQRNQRSPTLEQQEEMNAAVQFFGTNAPDQFEYHFYKYAAGNYNLDLLDHLIKAESLRPNNTDVQVQMAAANIIQGNDTLAIEYINKLVESDRLSSSALEYGADILNSVPENGVLITHGFDDSYATWFLKHDKALRGDVILISLDFLQSKAYRVKKTNEGINIPEAEIVDVAFLKELLEKNPDKSMNISMTTPKEYLEPIQENLYVNGLVLNYSQQPYDNFKINENLWNSQLEKHLVTGAIDEKGKNLSANYLPMLFQMRGIYSVNGENDKIEQMDDVIDRIGVQSKKQEQVNKLKKAY